MNLYTDVNQRGNELAYGRRIFPVVFRGLRCSVPQAEHANQAWLFVRGQHQDAREAGLPPQQRGVLAAHAVPQMLFSSWLGNELHRPCVQVNGLRVLIRSQEETRQAKVCVAERFRGRVQFQISVRTPCKNPRSPPVWWGRGWGEAPPGGVPCRPGRGGARGDGHRLYAI